MKNEILVVDDNPDIRFLLSSLLKDKGFVVREAANFNQALNEVNKKLPDLALIDVKLDKSDHDGIEILSHIKNIDKDLPVVMISGHANIQMAVDSLKLGAFEFVQKPFDSERIMNFINRGIENYNLKKENKYLQNKLFYSYELIGESLSISRIRELIKKIGSTDSRVFITGPTGSGKELVARKIHKYSNRSKNPFVIVNGALLDPEKYELELFGQEKDDSSINYGFFEKASGGTLLIDEVAEIPLETQAKILRVLIDQKFKRINGSGQVNVNFRIIATSTKDILNEIDKGNFREDLFHRLNVVPINLISLSERTEDIPQLIKYFSKKIAETNGIPEAKIDIKNEIFYKYSWPGNIRELRNLVERLTILSVNETEENINQLIKDSLIQKKIDTSDKISDAMSYPLKEAREKFEKTYLLSQLKKHFGNISKTAEFVGMERSALHRKLKSLGIKGIN